MRLLYLLALIKKTIVKMLLPMTASSFAASAERRGRPSQLTYFRRADSSGDTTLLYNMSSI